MKALFGLCVLPYPMNCKGKNGTKADTGESRMWIKAVAPECVAEFFHNYENALGICGKGSESGSCNESTKPQRSPSPMTQATDAGLESAKSYKYFSHPGEAEWGC